MMRTSGSGADRRRIATAVVLALVATASFALLSGMHTSATWVHWLGSAVALVTALATVVIVESTWQRAIDDATSDGLVEPAA